MLCRRRLTVLLHLMALLVGLPSNVVLADNSEPRPRWYAEEHVKIGAQIFLANCASCHGKKAEGLADDWRAPNSDGSYPPPPLNGSAHAWHHSLSGLWRTISEGGIRVGGKMPGFKGRLTNEEMLAAIAYFQAFWSDEIYKQWEFRGGVK